MAEPAPAPPESSTEAGPYRPLAGLALASIAVAGSYAVVVSAFALMAIIGGNPVFLSPWMLALPVVAVILASVARWQIRHSEGARSGLALANWAWWLGLIFGVVHAAIFFGTLLAIWTQAQGELERSFFAKIQQDNIDEAFQFTLDPEQRATRKEIRERFLSMEGGKKGPLSKFKENEIVRIIQGGGEGLHTDSMGIKSMDLSSNGYGIALNYRITSPEGVFVVQFTLRSKDSKESRKRRWRLVLRDTDTFVVRKELSPLGEKMLAWQTSAHDFANAWLFQRNMGLVENTFLGTCPPEARDARGRQYQTSFLASSVAAIAAALGDGGQSPPLARFAPLLDANLGCQLYMPGFQRFSQGEFLDKTDFEAPRKHKEQILAEFDKNFLHPNVMGFRPQADPVVIRRVEGESPHLEALVSIDLAILDTSGPPGPKYVGQGELVVVSDRVPESEAPQWRVAALKLLSGATPPSGPPGKMGGMPGGQSRPGSEDE